MPDREITQKEWKRLVEYVALELESGETRDRIMSDLASQGLTDEQAAEILEAVELSEGEEDEESGETLEERFPHMSPVKSTPSMFTVNGFGLGVYGQRDFDSKTQTYVKTHCLCAIFIPFFCLGAYRVFKDPSGGGWYFLGKEPLSGFARFWNWFFVLGIASLIGMGMWNAHTGSADYIANQKLEEADSLRESGEFLKAARIYESVASGGTSHASRAAESVNQLIAGDQYDNATLAEKKELLQIGARVHRRHSNVVAVSKRAAELIPVAAAESKEEAVELWKLCAEVDPDSALSVLDEMLTEHLRDASVEQRAVIFQKVLVDHYPMEVSTGLRQRARKLVSDHLVSDPDVAIELYAQVLARTPLNEYGPYVRELLSTRADDLNANQFLKVVETSWQSLEVEDRDWVIEQSLDWLEKHPETAPLEAIAIVDVSIGYEPENPERRAKARLQLLEQAVAENPDNLQLSEKLALVLETEGESDRVYELLMPFKDQIQDTESARLLGQAMAAKGDFNASYELLEPYVESRLSSLHEAEQQLDDALEQANKQAISSLESGRAAGFNYREYENSTDARKQEMVSEFIVKRMQDSENVRAAQSKMREQGAIVPVALDLGIVTLRRAQSLESPEDRQSGLEKAEKTFLAIQGVAGDSDRYQLYLGQVYYWLGKQEEGHKVFDDLLKNQNRGYDILMAISGVLYEIGVLAEVRSLTEEAYEIASNQDGKYAAAQLRALSSSDTQDRIEWLNKSDPNLPSIKAELATTRGHAAAEAGQDPEAIRHYQTAITAYEKMQKSAAVYNNGALVYLAVYNLNGEREALRKGTEWLKEAVALDPSEAIGMSNLATNQIRLGLQELAGANIDLQKLNMSGDFRVLQAAATDQASLTSTRQLVAAQADIAAAIENFEKVVVLSPKRSAAYGFLISAYDFTRDVDSLTRIVARLDEAQLDLTESIVQTLEYYRGTDDADDIARWQVDLADARAQVAQLQGGDRAVSDTLAVSRLIGLETRPIQRDAPADHDQLVKLAEQVHTEAPSLTSRRVLIRALLFRASHQLSVEQPEFAETLQKCSRSVGMIYVVAAAMADQQAMGTAVREHPDVKRSVDLIAELIETFPDMCSDWDWAMLKGAQHAAEEQAREFIVSDPLLQQQRLSGQRLSPVNAIVAVNIHWYRLAKGDEAGAQAVLDEVTKATVPIPAVLTQAR